MKNITKEQFVRLLREAGITTEQMHTLHRSFEKQYPEQHEAFLRHLGIGEQERAELRSRSAG
jgi:hypothetical protein